MTLQNPNKPILQFVYLLACDNLLYWAGSAAPLVELVERVRGLEVERTEGVLNSSW